jgi:hypothetical protein
VRLAKKADEMTNTLTSALPTPEQFIASAVKYLLEGRDEEAASVLLTCQIETLSLAERDYGTEYVDIGLRGPRVAYDLLTEWSWREHDSVARRIRSALEAVIPLGCTLGEMEIRAELVSLDPEWMAELIEQARGKAVNNQAADAENFQLWNNLRFRSPAEVKIAEALDKTGVMFFPNCKGRMSQGPRRANREPDFLVCQNGKWGILEVDGDAWHPATSAVQDHERDRVFHSYGIKVVQRFAGKHCMDVPDAVVERFLSILDRNG